MINEVTGRDEQAAQCVGECMIKAHSFKIQDKDFYKFSNPICWSYGFRDFDEAVRLAMVLFKNKTFSWASFYKTITAKS